MSNGEGKGSKALELLIQVSAWTGGILAAAVGGFLIAFGSKDTPPEVLTYFKWAVIPLVLALLGTWYIQIHTALHARELELAEAKKAAAQAAAAVPAAAPPAIAAPAPAAPATGQQPVTTAGPNEADGDKPKATRPGSIRGSIWFQVFFQTIALVAIAIGVGFYKGPSPEPWSLLASQANDQQISYLIKVRIPNKKEEKDTKEGKEKRKGTTQLRLLVSDASGNWRVCPIDMATDDDRVQCPTKPASTAGGPALQLMAEPILFHKLQYKLRHKVGRASIDLTSGACNAKKAILKASASGVFVVGSHDRDHVSGNTVDSNESLAQLRAAAVAAYLAENNDCGPAVASVISLNAAPVLATSDVRPGSDLAADRSVKVYGLVSKARSP